MKKGDIHTFTIKTNLPILFNIPAPYPLLPNTPNPPFNFYAMGVMIISI